jgi:iron complex transport system ATP-binding protein
MSHALACRNLQLSVPGRVLCPAVTLTIEPGQLWGVLGRNGSGKSTLVHALAGLSPLAEAVTLNGSALTSHASRERACEIGVLLQQEDGDFWGSVLEYVLLGRYARARSLWNWSGQDEQAAQAALDAVQLSPLAQRRFVTLSGGERQRARIAQVLAQAPRFLLLDEPLQHLDVKHQVQTLTLLQQLAGEGARAVAIVLHDALWAGRYCTHALLLHDGGETMEGPARELLNRGNLERLYGCAFAELTCGAGGYFVPHV